MKRTYYLCCGVIAGLLSAHSQLVLAQPMVVVWESVAKITNGTCGDNATAHVSERPGAMHLGLVYPNGKQYAEFDIALAPDGSGKTEFKGIAGAATVLEVSAGSGKRMMKTSQATGICQWAWIPK